MKILLLGVGLQGRAALRDLATDQDVTAITAGDTNLDPLERYVDAQGWRGRVRTARVDAAERTGLDRLLADGFDVVVDLLPPALAVGVARAALDHGTHLVNSCFVRPEIEALAGAAAARGVALLPECGLDPGLDLLLLRDAVSALERVEEIRSYGAGLPEPAAADNAIGYKITWSLEGVLGAYRRPARLIRDGREERVDGASIFEPSNVHELEIEGLGRLEAYPNGDALPLIPRLGLDRGALRHLGCYTMRYPGHCDFWRRIAALHLLDPEPVAVDGVAVDRLRFLAEAVGPHIRLRDTERDVAALRLEVVGVAGGRRARVVRELLDRRDLETGLTAMSRTVGFSAAIAARLIADGTIAGRGLLTTARDVPFGRFAAELERRGINVRSEIELI
jgi:lysine 6-dehydrogenase